MSSQPLLKQSPVSKGVEDSHKGSVAAPLGDYTFLCISILDRKEEQTAVREVKDSHSGLLETQKHHSSPFLLLNGFKTAK